MVWSDGCGCQNKSYWSGTICHFEAEVSRSGAHADGMRFNAQRNKQEAKWGSFFSPHDHVLAMQMVRQVPFFNNTLEVLFTDSIVDAILEVCASWKTC
ncbi:hypothetical protein PoB_002652900 [Plakobranchus ocellatus]|uniref:Uncharacterized protein n=1 Tax=Plakobranchus ocellatus TaxID=259542 RepID=A0AAV4A0A5_9GAST|nr:hypothetical protein PoB_002652900 [Plakobranchus ocellatus]